MYPYKNAHYNRWGTIDCDINHPEFGWIPTTLAPDDPPTAEMFHAVKAAGPEPYDSTEDDARAAQEAAQEAARAAIRATAMDTTKPAEERLNALLELLGV
jgi:hypothetical protein